eukprot:maker-scaffold416_size178335-snap-gene-0.25 protein:Tk04592 transcript:maker-scaffold416_size178335-snap-gene-0.25-mRNA-1 annotation:"short transient receptor potential channel 5-like"
MDKIYPMLRIKHNNEAMVRASKKHELPTVGTMFKHGFRISSALFDDSDRDDLGIQHHDVNLELARLEAMANPAYLVAEARYDRVDPVRRAFHLLEAVQERSAGLIAFGNKLELITKTVRRFVWTLLNNCEGKKQVELFLGQDDDIDGLSLKGSTLLPRIYQGLQLNLEDFVTHDNCQQVIREAFYGGQERDQLAEESSLDYVITTLIQLVGTPWYSLWYILYKLKCGRDQPQAGAEPHSNIHRSTSLASYESITSDQCTPPRPRSLCKQWATNLNVPFHRMTSHVGWYLLFVAWVLVSHMNIPSSALVGLKSDSYNYWACVWAIGFTFADIQIMVQLMRSVKLKHGSHWDLVWAKAKKALSNAYIDYRIVSHLALIAGYAIEFAGYRYKEMSLRNRCFDVDEQFSLIRIGNCFQGMAIVLIITQLLQLFRLHPTVGNVYIGMRRCISIVASFMLAYLIITVAFALGLHFILRQELNDCSLLNIVCYKSAFHMERKSVGVFCSLPNQTRFPCQDECWIAYLSNPANASGWAQECRTPTHPLIPSMAKFDGVQESGSSETSDNQFRTMRSSLKTLFWSVFDPGHPEVVGCSTGITRFTSLTLWGIYNVIIVVILLNLLIALMNEAMASITENKLASWKYHRTHVWMDYCNKAVVLPAPMNLINLMVDIFKCLCCNECVDKYIPEVIKLDTSLEDDKLEHQQYHDLMRVLVSKYVSDSQDSVENDNTKDMIDTLRSDIKHLAEERNAGVRDFEALVALIQSLDAKVESKLKRK